ncbi:uncharacterized protein LOC143914507 [Arctopsyche grandis]|uniref:uncharacterized protein LOC143914507 n=1 Tax=Arctopsyche grandis TaxID=121162 RepID=UPI00406D90AE
MKTLLGLICFSIASVVLFSTQVDGLQCYTCNSQNDSRCDSLRELGVFIKDCTEEPIGNSTLSPIMCRKILQTVEYSNMGTMETNTRVIRGCGWVDSNYTGRCYTRSGYGGRQVVCSCKGDNCNSSHVSLPTKSVVASLVIFLVMFYIVS